MKIHENSSFSLKLRKGVEILHFSENELKWMKFAKWAPNTIEFHWFNKLLRQVAQKMQKVEK